MPQIGRNLKIIRVLKKMNQAEFAQIFGMSRPTYAKYENDQAVVDEALLYKMSKELNIPMEELAGLKPVKNGTHEKESSLRQINPYVILVPLVSQYAYAGYLSGYSDEEYMESLPTISFPIGQEPKGNYVCFEVRGDSMDSGGKDSYEAGDLLLCRELSRSHWRDKLHINQWDFVIVHKTNGILLKRIIAHNTSANEITIHSLNPEYQDDKIAMDDIAQLFSVVTLQRPLKRR